VLARESQQFDVSTVRARRCAFFKLAMASRTEEDQRRLERRRFAERIALQGFQQRPERCALLRVVPGTAARRWRIGLLRSGSLQVESESAQQRVARRFVTEDADHDERAEVRHLFLRDSIDGANRCDWKQRHRHRMQPPVCPSRQFLAMKPDERNGDDQAAREQTAQEVRPRTERAEDHECRRRDDGEPDEGQYGEPGEPARRTQETIPCARQRIRVEGLAKRDADGPGAIPSVEFFDSFEMANERSRMRFSGRAAHGLAVEFYRSLICGNRGDRVEGPEAIGVKGVDADAVGTDGDGPVRAVNEIAGQPQRIAKGEPARLIPEELGAAGGRPGPAERPSITRESRCRSPRAAFIKIKPNRKEAE